MIILYKNETAKIQFCSEYKKTWRYPEQVKKKLEAAENFIKNSSSLLDVANYPPFRFEKLKGNRKHEWSIRLGNTGYRVTLIPCDADENEILRLYDEGIIDMAQLHGNESDEYILSLKRESSHSCIPSAACSVILDIKSSKPIKCETSLTIGIYIESK